MANTRYLTTIVEAWIRDQLQLLHGQPFEKRTLQLASGRDFEFDAVSLDGSIVAAIKTSSGKTSGGNYPAGKVNSCIADLWYLHLVEAPRRMLVLTNPDFHQIFVRKMERAIPDGLEVHLLPLPPEMQAEVDGVVQLASAEMSQPAIEAAVAVAVEEELDAQ